MKPIHYNLQVSRHKSLNASTTFDTPHAIINLGEGEVRVFIGDFKQVDLIEVFSISPESQISKTSIISINQNGVSYKQLTQLKSLVHILIQKSYLMKLPIVVTGEEALRKNFYSLIQKNYRAIEFQVDATKWTTIQILDESQKFKQQIIDLYEEEIQFTISKLNHAGRIVTDLNKIIPLLKSKDLVKVYFAKNKNIMGQINWESGQITTLNHAHHQSSDVLNDLFQKMYDEEIRVEIIDSKFFIGNAVCMAIIKQERRWNSIAI